MHVDLSRVHGGACSVSLPADAPVRRLSPRSSGSLCFSLCPGTLNLQLATAGEPAPATAQLLGPGTAGSIASGHDPSPSRKTRAAGSFAKIGAKTRCAKTKLPFQQSRGHTNH